MSVRLALIALEIGPARVFLPVLDLWRRAPDIDVRVFVTAESIRVMDGVVLDRQGVANELEMADFDVVAMSASGYPVEGAIRRRGKAAGVPVFQFVDQWYNYGPRFPASSDPRWPDRIGLIDAGACREAVQEGLPAERLAIVGSPAWDSEPALPPASPAAIAFFGQPVARDYGRSLGYDEWDVWSVVRQVQVDRADLIQKVIYCPHPSYSDATAERIAPADLVHDAEEALRRSGTAISMFSSPMISAYLRGRRVISVQPALRGPDRGMLSRRGHIPRVEDAPALINALLSTDYPPLDLKRDLCDSPQRISDAILGLVGP